MPARALAVSAFAIDAATGKLALLNQVSSRGAVGLTPPPEGWHPPDLLVGAVFFFLLVWGIGAPFFRAHHRESERRFPHVA